MKTNWRKYSGLPLLDKDIPIHWVAGNHDAGDAPTQETLSRYRQRYGNDNYSFNHEGSHFIIINSCVCFGPSNVPHEWETLVEFLRKDLQLARDLGCQNIVVFMHHPLFLSSPEEGDGYFVVPRERRRILYQFILIRPQIHKGSCARALQTQDQPQSCCTRPGSAAKATNSFPTQACFASRLP
jgi:hypothetical protein